MDRIFLCSFGNSSYLSSLSRLRAQAEETGWFYRVECSTEKNLSAFFRQEAADLLNRKCEGLDIGFGNPRFYFNAYNKWNMAIFCFTQMLVVI